MGTARGSLTALGIGIRAPSQATLEASAQIERAEKVFSIVADPLAESWIRKLNPNTESFGSLYAVGKPRMQTYREMVERITGAVREDLRTCAVSYGHPGIFAYPLHESIRILREEGYEARMLPGVSAEDCLFADLGIDPAVTGCRSYEATEFLVHRRAHDTTTGLMLWQVGSIAEPSYRDSDEVWNREGLSILMERLLEAYKPDHEVVVYEAARLPISQSTVTRLPLRNLPSAAVSLLATLYVPAMEKPNVDTAMAQRLGLLR
jgi:uncharacterized protein YabN with tetrapyrrole methylase and pyrophosphatase domain